MFHLPSVSPNAPWSFSLWHGCIGPFCWFLLYYFLFLTVVSFFLSFIVGSSCWRGVRDSWNSVYDWCVCPVCMWRRQRDRARQRDLVPTLGLFTLPHLSFSTSTAPTLPPGWASPTLHVLKTLCQTGPGEALLLIPQICSIVANKLLVFVCLLCIVLNFRVLQLS